MTQYQTSLAGALQTLDSLRALEPQLCAAADTVLNCLLAGGKLLLCGNGGSASDSTHIATEFTCRFQNDRRPYPAISLNADAGLLTAIANDYGYQEVFARQVTAYGRPGDVLFVLSTSGNSRNLLPAIEAARASDVRTVTLLGKGGGGIAGVAEIELIVPGNVTARIQEAHKFLLHVLCEIVEAGLPRE